MYIHEKIAQFKVLSLLNFTIFNDRQCLLKVRGFLFHDRGGDHFRFRFPSLESRAKSILRGKSYHIMATRIISTRRRFAQR